MILYFFFFFQAEDGIRDYKVTGVQTCALPISAFASSVLAASGRTSYLSKSKWMSFSSGIEANSAGAGRAVVAAGAGAGAGVDGVLGTGAAGAGVLGAGAGVAGGAAGAGADGGGAATEVVAGRFAQPAATTPSTRSSMIVR